ncbi:MAG: lipid-binding SYLF domain-containing protein [Alphaproteobacteria bacterium]|nr:lipid-binding SYLF domain-containing protein [Alphaproteobacteria bacterium]
MRTHGGSSLLARALAGAVAAMVMALASGAVGADEQQGLVDKARITIEAFTDDPEMAPMRTLLGRARGVLIFPELLKAGFFLGGEGGRGVLLGRRDGKWSAPAFYTLAAGSFGLQIGVQSSEAVFVLMTRRAIDAVIHNEVKLGADVSAAIGPVGKGLEASTTTNLRDDIYAYARSTGVFAGASFEGAVIDVAEDWNRDYYGRAVAAEAIVLEHKVDHKGAAGLKEALATAAAP